MRTKESSRWLRLRRVSTGALAAGIMLVTAWAIAQQAQQQKIKVRPGAVQPLRVANTILKVTQNTGDFENWVNEVTMNEPQAFEFQWSTHEVGITSARWVVTDAKLGGSGEAHVLGEGQLSTIPSEGHISVFTINLQPPIVPPQPPAKPYVLTYFVHVITSDAQGVDRKPSTAAKVTYRAPGPPTEFEDDMGMEGNTYDEAVLQLAYEALKAKYGLLEPLAPVTHGPNLAAFRPFLATSGSASIEVFHTAPQPTIFVSVARKALDSSWPIAYQWFEYTLDGEGKVVPRIGADQDPPPDVTPAPLQDTGAWAAYDPYYDEAFWRGDDPPHWTPILIKDDPAYIGFIHQRMQTPFTQSQAVGEIDRVRAAVKEQDLTDRAMKSWQQVKLCGAIEAASFPGGDFGADHSAGYNDGEDVETGPFEEVTDPSWPGMDWDLMVIPDPAYAYLASPYRPSVRVEVEHFALPANQAYWPQAGEWVQAVGRWVTDNGHPEPSEDNPDLVNGFYTEIHPPELMVTTRSAGAYATDAWVSVIGSWLGDSLSFVVNPPPRPSATATLKHRIAKADGSDGFDRKDNAELDCVTRGGAGNPSYLLCTARPTASVNVVLVNSGVVGMSQYRGLACVVKCWWDEPTATLQGEVKAGDKPAEGAFVFCRQTKPAEGPWKAYEVHNDGRYVIGGLAAGATYAVRPAGSGWNFEGVPKEVTITGGTNTVSFTGIRQRLEVPRVPFRTPIAFGRRSVQSAALQFGAPGARRTVQAAESQVGASRGRQPVRASEPQVDASSAKLRTRRPAGVVVPSGSQPSPEEAAMTAIRSMLITLEEPSGTLGVLGNGLGLRESGVVPVHLMGLVGWDGQPVTDFASSYALEPDDGTIVINGTTNGGVPGATIRAHLMLGNEDVGFRTGGVAEAQTNASGVAMFRFKAGTHVEGGKLVLEVVENPVNPWFTPTLEGSSYLFYPARAGDDSGPSTPYVINALDLKRLSAAVALRGAGESAETGSHFIREAGERRMKASAVLRETAKTKQPFVPPARQRRVLKADAEQGGNRLVEPLL